MFLQLRRRTARTDIDRDGGLSDDNLRQSHCNRHQQGEKCGRLAGRRGPGEIVSRRKAWPTPRSENFICNPD
jgi:hypothetical protein